jgi:hypothetical protein
MSMWCKLGWVELLKMAQRKEEEAKLVVVERMQATWVLSNVMDRIEFKVRRVSNCGLRQLLRRSSRGLGHLTKHGVSEMFPFEHLGIHLVLESTTRPCGCCM